MAKFDLAKTQVLAELFDTPRERRDAGWVERFYAAAPDASLAGFETQVRQGPDGFPYFEMAIPGEGKFTPFCITRILDFVLDNGFGAVVWPNAQRTGEPGWVFTYGNLLSYSLGGKFDDRSAEEMARRGGGERLNVGGHKVMVGEPSESLLPARTRKVIEDYMRTVFKHPKPEIRLLVDPALNPPQQLMFNLNPQQFGGDEGRLMGALRRLSWFLPPSYSILAG
jgi:hypothetical protein